MALKQAQKQTASELDWQFSGCSEFMQCEACLRQSVDGECNMLDMHRSGEDIGRFYKLKLSVDYENVEN